MGNVPDHPIKAESSGAKPKKSGKGGKGKGKGEKKNGSDKGVKESASSEKKESKEKKSGNALSVDGAGKADNKAADNKDGVRPQKINLKCIKIY